MDGVAVASLVVLAVVSVIWTVALIAAALETRRAARRVQEFIRTVELELKPTLLEVREAIRNWTGRRRARRIPSSGSGARSSSWSRPEKTSWPLPGKSARCWGRVSSRRSASWRA